MNSGVAISLSGNELDLDLHFFSENKSIRVRSIICKWETLRQQRGAGVNRARPSARPDQHCFSTIQAGDVLVCEKPQAYPCEFCLKKGSVCEDLMNLAWRMVRKETEIRSSLTN